MSRLALLAAPVAVVLATGFGDAGGVEPPAPSITEVGAADVLARDPYLGVHCKVPNTYACDRVCLAVWLRDPAARVDAELAGHEFALDDRAYEPVERMFTGCLQPAGLIDGPLQVDDDDGPGRWIGREPARADIALRIVGSDGTRETLTTNVGLAPGYG
jgi:hypothetical protein